MIHCDIRRCVGCRMCEVACSDAHFGAVSPALSRIRVAKLEEIGIDLAVSCLGCREKPCLECPVEALSVGEPPHICLDARRCSGCAECVDRCPVGAIGFHDGSPLLCDLCGGSPSCVDTCPTGALTDERNTQVSLARFTQYSGSPSQKRANYAGLNGRSLREDWEKGRRVDS